jgi:two-component system, response regulator
MPEKGILLVEDNPDDAALALRALQKNHIPNPVTVAHDGAEALDLLIGDRATPFGLVLLDLRLPKMHGLEVLKRIRADRRTKLVPVVVLTTSTEESDLVQAYTFGANSYVRKSTNFQDFVNSVAQLSMYWLMLNEGPPAIDLTPPSAQ